MQANSLFFRSPAGRVPIPPPGSLPDTTMLPTDQPLEIDAVTFDTGRIFPEPLDGTYRAEFFTLFHIFSCECRALKPRSTQYPTGRTRQGSLPDTTMLPTDRSFEMGLPEPPYWSETAASGGLRLALRHIAAGLARKASIQSGDMAPAPLEARFRGDDEKDVREASVRLVPLGLCP
jgi:hypothetical protein